MSFHVVRTEGVARQEKERPANEAAIPLYGTPRATLSSLTTLYCSGTDNIYRSIVPIVHHGHDRKGSAQLPTPGGAGKGRERLGCR